jgi:phage terminase large subunit GpA-like protein
MTSWSDMAFEFLRRKDTPADLQTFVNTYLGEVWEARHNAPQYERIMLYREGYEIGKLPDDAKPLLVTVGADIQKDRIEAEIVAWGKDKVSWSIDYRVFPGDTSDPNSNAWGGLQWTLESEHAGMPISMALIDSGYNTPQVYQFCSQYYAGVSPVMGDLRIGRQRSVFRRAPVQDHAGLERVDLYVDAMKQELYGYLTRIKNPEDPDPPGYCHFPIGYGEKYFRQLTAEERAREIDRHGHERYVWRKIRDRNEAHDCRVYAMGALNVYAQDVMESIGEEQIDWQKFWQIMTE